MTPEIKGSYRDVIYVAIYRCDGLRLIWSASIEDDDGAVTFMAGHFTSTDETAPGEQLLRQNVCERIDAYRDRDGSAALH